MLSIKKSIFGRILAPFTPVILPIAIVSLFASDPPNAEVNVDLPA